MSEGPKGKQKVGRWYFGGLASAMAVCFTHPLDLIKVALQTQREGKLKLIDFTVNTIKKQGFLSLYNGLSASIMRQLTYSTARFAIYEGAKLHLGQTNFSTKIGLAGISGGIGGLVSTPTDVVNVRMQNDVKLPLEMRRNYKNVVDGLWRVFREEGPRGLCAGAGTASFRAAIMAIGQLATYDQIKLSLLNTGYFNDGLGLQFLTSTLTGIVATAMTQPLDVIKTRLMNAKPGEFKNMAHAAVYTAKEGPMAFFKGFVPAFVRLGPQTILVFIFFEQLKEHFGYIPE